jgi:hypothetical protein
MAERKYQHEYEKLWGDLPEMWRKAILGASALPEHIGVEAGAKAGEAAGKAARETAKGFWSGFFDTIASKSVGVWIIIGVVFLIGLWGLIAPSGGVAVIGQVGRRQAKNIGKGGWED